MNNLAKVLVGIVGQCHLHGRAAEALAHLLVLVLAIEGKELCVGADGEMVHQA